MCSDNWESLFPENNNGESVAEPKSAPFLAPVSASNSPFNFQRDSVGNVNQDGAIQSFLAMDFSSLPVSQYVIRMQKFEFRHHSLQFAAVLFDRWLSSQISHDNFSLESDSCDVCEYRLNDLASVAHFPNRALMIPCEYAEVPHFLKHIACGHAICSTCLVAKRFIFVNLGLPICCNKCETCWLQI